MPHRVVIVAYDGVQSLDVAGPAEVFAGACDLAAAAGGAHPYDVSIVSAAGGVVATESAVTLMTAPADSIEGTIDTLVVPGGRGGGAHLADDAGFLAVLEHLLARTTRLLTICSGALVVAPLGVLDGRRVTTHWARADQLARLHPDVEVDPDPIHVHTSPGPRTDPRWQALDVWTSAGVTAGIDLALAVVEHDVDAETAQTIARWLVMYVRRPGGQSQFAAPTWHRAAPPGPIREAQDAVLADPGADHRVGTLARRVAMSERHFLRSFREQVGVSPARWIARVRVDAARHQLETSDDTVAAIARRCGFGSDETLRRTFHRHLGVAPDAYRSRFSRERPDQT